MAATGMLTGSGLFAGSRARAQGAAGQPMPEVKALVFDTFGTVVDWRASVALEVEALAKRKGLNVDAAKFADAWRAGYGPSAGMRMPSSVSDVSARHWSGEP